MPAAKVIKGQYIVSLKPTVKAKAHVESAAATIVKETNAKAGMSATAANANTIKHVYEGHAFNGYAGKFDAEALARIRNHPDVAFVEPDQIATTFTTQPNAPWGLARTSSRSRVGAGASYSYDPNGGAGVKVFVIDTGIYVGHSDFGGRATWGANFAGDGQNSDGNGHGSHVSGTIGGSTYGIAKKAQLVAVKVLGSDGSGSFSGIIGGINWATQQHSSGNGGAKGSVINMSLGGSYSDSLNQATTAAVNAGIYVALAGGNSNQDACGFSPASAEGGFTLAASDINDTIASFSNWGQCCDSFAPGVNILSVSTSCSTCSRTMSGTSMSSPHAAGLMAYYASLSSSRMSPAQMIQTIKSAATKNVIGGNINGSPNQILYNNYSG
ncbi:serine protease [Ramicandelaber brevisporus]|nr:serine protease [Ramicandelaber brevisporus]